MAQDINLDGHEVTVIKALGLTGGEISGQELMKRMPDMNAYDLIDVVKGLIMQGYVESDKSGFYNEEELMDVNFNVNSGYMRDLREAMDPRAGQPKSRRVRRE
jgi:hypothetical protein